MVRKNNMNFNQKKKNDNTIFMCIIDIRGLLSEEITFFCSIHHYTYLCQSEVSTLITFSR